MVHSKVQSNGRELQLYWMSCDGRETRRGNGGEIMGGNGRESICGNGGEAVGGNGRDSMRRNRGLQVAAFGILLALSGFRSPFEHAHAYSPSPPPVSCGAAGTPPAISAPYAPGIITVDGISSDWDSVEGYLGNLVQPQPTGEVPTVYPNGNGTVTMKAAHDGHFLYILLVLPGPYVYSPPNARFGVSASLMFGIGSNATFYDMGGCPQLGDCSPTRCKGHEVDLAFFKVSSAIPGRQYGHNIYDTLQGTGTDRLGNLTDEYGFNSACKFPDQAPSGPGMSPEGVSDNDWIGAWGHTSVDSEYGLISSQSPFGKPGKPGSFVFEFSRPLRTADHFQQDIQFTIGESHRFGVAVWYPVNGKKWRVSEHYVVSCDWAALSLDPPTLSATSSSTQTVNQPPSQTVNQPPSQPPSHIASPADAPSTAQSAQATKSQASSVEVSLWLRLLVLIVSFMLGVLFFR